jgi:NAD(P)-dependent dehydrogenase (short-subunit alcohol dehydrogenase family)
VDGQLSHSVAVITGASRGIGAAMAKAFAQEGASLCLIARHQAGLDDLAAQLPLHNNAQVMTLALDVTDRDACFQAVADTLQHLGHIDTLVNNAGIYKSQPFLNYAASDFQNMLDVNFFGVLHFMQACLPHMQARNQGSIINIASTAGKWGSRNQSAYNVSKHAVVGLTRCVALEASPYQVTVNAICPGFVETDMLDELRAQASTSAGTSAEDFEKAALARVPLGRMMRAEEIASMAVFLASKNATGMTGQSIHMDGGMVL